MLHLRLCVVLVVAFVYVFACVLGMCVRGVRLRVMLVVAFVFVFVCELCVVSVRALCMIGVRL